MLPTITYSDEIHLLLHFFLTFFAAWASLAETQQAATPVIVEVQPPIIPSSLDAAVDKILTEESLNKKRLPLLLKLEKDSGGVFCFKLHNQLRHLLTEDKPKEAMRSAILFFTMC